MKQFVLLLCLSLPVFSQVNPQVTGAGAPSPSTCSTTGQQYLDTTNHVLYACSNGTWGVIGTGQFLYKAQLFEELAFASLPTAAPTGRIYIVNDASAAGSCAAGGGTARSICRWTGSAWESLGGIANGVTNAAASLPANQVLVGNTYPDILTTPVTIDGSGNVAAVANLSYTGSLLGPQQTATNDATKPIANKAMKWVVTNGWTLAVSGTDMSNPSLALASADASGSLVRPQADGQISAVSHDAVTNGEFAVLYGTAGSDGQLTSSAVCTSGYRYLGTWAETAAAGLRLLNYDPGICGQDHVISWDVVATGDTKTYLPVYFACTIYAVDVTADQSGTFASDIDRKSAAIPNTTTDKISGTDGPALSGPAQINLNHAPSSWGSTVLAVGDVLNLNVTTFTTVTHVHVQLRCR